VIGKGGERGGRNAVTVHEGLGEGLGRLKEGSHQRRKIIKDSNIKNLMKIKTKN
jgi:hypothetical protein